MYKYKKFFTIMDKTIRDFSDEEASEAWESAVETISDFAEFNFDFIANPKEKKAAAWQLFVDALIGCGDESSDNPLHPVAVNVVEMIHPKDFPVYHYNLVIGSDVADGIPLKEAIATMDDWLDGKKKRRQYDTIDGTYWLNRDLTVTRKPKLIDVSKKRRKA